MESQANCRSYLFNLTKTFFMEIQRFRLERPHAVETLSDADAGMCKAQLVCLSDDAHYGRCKPAES